MAVERITFNSAEAARILKSPGVLADLSRRAHAIAAAAGGENDFGVDVEVGANRARATVWTKTSRARRAEAANRTLSRAIGAGG